MTKGLEEKCDYHATVKAKTVLKHITPYLSEYLEDAYREGFQKASEYHDKKNQDLIEQCSKLIQSANLSNEDEADLVIALEKFRGGK